jgi:hypothetical protein
MNLGRKELAPDLAFVWFEPPTSVTESSLRCLLM